MVCSATQSDRSRIQVDDFAICRDYITNKRIDVEPTDQYGIRELVYGSELKTYKYVTNMKKD